MRCLVAVCAILALGVPAAVRGDTSVPQILQQAEASINSDQFASAETLLARALKISPENTDVLYRLGYVRFRQRKLVPARSNFSAVVKLAPPAHYSRYFLGRISLMEDKPKEAVTWLEPIVEAKASVFDTTSQLAAAYALVGLHAKAAGALQVAITEAPWDGSLHYRLGRLYLQTGQKELASQAFESSRRLKNASREDVEALMRTAQLLNAGDRQAAIRTGTQIHARDSADPEALVALGVIYGNGNLQEAALQSFERAAERDDKLFQAHYNRGLALLKLNRAAEALTPLARSVQLLPQSIDANRAYGLAAVLNQKYVEAIAPLERVWQSDPKNVRVGALLANAYLRSGTPARAVEVLRTESLRLSSEPAPLLLRVEALNAVENPEGALEAAEEVRARFPQAPEAQMAFAQQLARVGRYQDARLAFADTLKLAPNYLEAKAGLADTLARSGEHTSAVEHYRGLLASGYTSPTARAGLARSLMALRDFEEARKVLEDGIKHNPSEVAYRVELSRVYARLGKPELANEQAEIVEKLRAGQAKR